MRLQSSAAPVVRWLTTLGFVALLIAVSIAPGVGRPDDSIFMWIATGTPHALKKVIHFVAYGTLTFLWLWTHENMRPPLLRVLVVLILSIGLGIALELYQTLVPGRYGTLMDMLINAAGTIAVLIYAQHAGLANTAPEEQVSTREI